MKLFGSYTSPYARHCRIALLDTGLTSEFIDTDYAQSAAASPTQRVPFLIDGDLQLTDSSSILRYFAEKVGAPFIESVREQEIFALTNTCMDATINLFLLERDGIGASQSAYLQRQQNRIDSTLAQLEDVAESLDDPSSVVAIRLACYLDWASFRGRIEIEQYPMLVALLGRAKTLPHFVKTAIPG
ncbi:MAG: glutathione S-transferase family protein [Pseudomonadales bacterium]